MADFIVQGRRFKKRLHAITFAQSLAAEQDVSVDVEVEVVDEVRHVRRSWACRMHPPGKKIAMPRINSPHMPLRAIGMTR